MGDGETNIYLSPNPSGLDLADNHQQDSSVCAPLPDLTQGTNQPGTHDNKLFLTQSITGSQ